ncbi:MAG: GIY-YIG nuclease family protein [Deltaproteobacteria bacterium]|nr:GIY-YIG nuclease family protein [Deltaproteobacteria bacterium]
MKKWRVYMLRCSDGSLYTGITNDLVSRLRAHHEKKGARYTRSRLPAELVYWEEAEDRSLASRREVALKKLSRKRKLELIAARRFPLKQSG